MKEQNRKLFLIKIAYWLGIGANAFWAVVLLFPKFYGILFGLSDYNPDLQTKLILGIGGTLMTGWTFLLLWAVRKPIERKSCYPINRLSCSIWNVHCGTYRLSGRKCI